MEDLPRDEFLKKLHGPRDSPILGVARLVDLDDKYLLNFSRRNNPVVSGLVQCRHAQI